MDTNYRPCTANTSYSFSNCIAKCFIAAAVKSNICRLPYIDGKTTCAQKLAYIIVCTIECPTESFQLETCTTGESYRRAVTMMDDLLFFGRWSANNCSCPRQCYQDLYIPYTETTQMDKNNANLGKLRIYYQVCYLERDCSSVKPLFVF